MTQDMVLGTASPTGAPVDYRVEGGTARVTLNAPDRRNVLDGASLTGLFDALEQAKDDDRVRVVVLAAVGKAFCAGADLSGTDGFAKDGPARYVAVLEAMLDHPKPLLACVQGHVAGGGNGLVAAADIAVAVESARFAFSEVRVGVVPAIVAVAAMPRMPARLAAELFLTGERVDAHRAADAGLLSRVVPDAAALEQAAAEYVQALTAGAPGAMRRTKDVLRSVPSMSRAEAFGWAREISASAFTSAEAAEGMAAFKARRRPSWALSE